MARLPSARSVGKTNRKKRNVHAVKPKKGGEKKYGTSKLEEDFARDFLDKLGVEYVYQYEAADIGRFYDFRIKDGPIIEINGTYWHSDPRVYEGKELNRTQKRNAAVDEYKKKWALMHGIPIYYVWEKDIRENPSKVMEFLREILRKKDAADKMRRRHRNTINEDK